MPQLQTAHRFLYELRLEFYKTLNISALDKLIMTGFNYHEIDDSRHKEIYTACLIALIHCYLGNKQDLINKNMRYAVNAVYDSYIDEKDKEYFDPVNIYSKITSYSGAGIAILSSLVNMKNWDWFKRNSEDYNKTLHNKIIEVAKNIDKIIAEGV